MSTYDSPLDGDVEIQLEDGISIGELILALEQDPRFEAMVIRVQAKAARRTGNVLGKWAQKPVPQTVQPQNPGTLRLT